MSGHFELACQVTSNWLQVLIVHCELSVLAYVSACYRNSAQPKPTIPTTPKPTSSLTQVPDYLSRTHLRVSKISYT